MSTTDIGNAFRDSVKQLLELTPQIFNVAPELRIAHQDVDIFYEELASTGTRRVACECKAYSQPLTRHDLEGIYAKYNPLRDTGEIDDIRVISQYEIGPTALAYCTSTGISHCTKEYLELSILDFRAYLRGLVAGYNADLKDTYSPLSFTDGTSAEGAIQQWLDSPTSQPFAILAGYGQGKTSLARHTAAWLAAQRLGGKHCRTPIVIPLGEISSQQSLDGLLGRLFTSQYKVPNYHFELFLELNRRGRFAMFLDGFDEMKYAMTLADFKYNVTQLHQLVCPDSKVLLLGRPSALISDEEERWVLKGKQRIGSVEIEIPDAPEYLVHTLAFFEPEQALLYIDKYSKQYAERRAAMRGINIDDDLRTSRLSEIRNHQELLDLAIRPVQAKMLAELLVSAEATWPPANRFELYDVFVRSMLEREVGKSARRPIPWEERLGFLERLSFWLWTKKQLGNFRAPDVPRNLLSSFDRDGSLDNLALVRELLVGSVLDKKLGDTYYFPHRSFLEFLVARWALSTKQTPQSLAAFAEKFSPEIGDFIVEAKKIDTISDWVDTAEAVESPLPLQFIDFLATYQWVGGQLMTPRAFQPASPRGLALLCRRTLANKGGVEAFNVVGHSASVLESQGGSSQAVRMAIVLMCSLVDQVSKDLKATLCEQIAAQVLIRCAPEFKRILGYAANAASSAAVDATNPWVKAYLNSFKVTAPKDAVFEMDIDELMSSLQSTLEPKYRIHEFLAARGIVQSVRLHSLQQWNSELAVSKNGAVVAQFARAYSSTEALVMVRSAARSTGRKNQTAD